MRPHYHEDLDEYGEDQQVEHNTEHIERDFGWMAKSWLFVHTVPLLHRLGSCVALSVPPHSRRSRARCQIHDMCHPCGLDTAGHTRDDDASSFRNPSEQA